MVDSSSSCGGIESATFHTTCAAVYRLDERNDARNHNRGGVNAAACFLLDDCGESVCKYPKLGDNEKELVSG